MARGRRLRVALLPGGLPVSYTVELANAISAEADVLLVVLGNPVEPESALQLADLRPRVRLYATRPVSRPFARPRNLSILLEIVQELRRFRPDILHVQEGDWLALLCHILCRPGALVTTIHDIELLGGQRSLGGRIVRFYFIRRSARIFVHGRSLRASFLAGTRLPETHVHAIPMGVHNIAPLLKLHDETPEDGSSALLFGWINYRKGLDWLVRAEPLVAKEIPSVRFIVAGRASPSDPHIVRCKSLIQDPARYEFHLHYITAREALHLFRRAAVVVLPYVLGSQSGVVPIAYQFRKPVVATNVGGLPELVEDGATGKIVPPRDPPALARAIIELLSDPELRHRLGEAGYEKLRTEMSWARISELTLGVYGEALRASRTRT